MNSERWVYLSSIEHLKEVSDYRLASWLLKEWSAGAKGNNLASAACYYLSHFVIPALQGEDVRKVVPKWVDEMLFHPVVRYVEPRVYEDHQDFAEGVKLSYERLLRVKTIDDALKEEKELICETVANDPIIYGTLERLQRVIMPQLRFERCLSTPYWNDLMKMNFVV